MAMGSEERLVEQTLLQAANELKLPSTITGVDPENFQRGGGGGGEKFEKKNFFL